MKKLLLLVFAVVLSSCASIDGPLYGDVDMTLPEGKARIVVYRIWSGTGAVHPASFYVNGEKIASLNNGGFNYIFVDPGKHIVSSGPTKNSYHKKVEFTATKGNSYFVGLQRGMPDDIYLGENLDGLDGYKLQPYKP